MDQEKFDQHLMDYLFDELDEVGRAAMKRKLEADADCRSVEAGLRATMEVALLPVEEPSNDLEERILLAAKEAEADEPWHRKVLRSLSWAGSHAMQPQLAMAALLMLVVGSAIVLLPARPGSVAVSPTKDGIPQRTPSAEPTAAMPEAPTPPSELAQRDEKTGPQAPAAAASGDSDKTPKLGEKEANEVFERAVANFRSGKHKEAQRDFASVSAAGGAKAASAALYEARAVRAHSGCGAAVPYYDRVRKGHGGGVGADASWEQADCHRQLSQPAKARALWLSLSKNGQYKARAVNELSNQGQVAGSGGKQVASKRKAAPPKATSSTTGGSTGKAPAVPLPKAPD